jgi:hypothetical protein
MSKAGRFKSGARRVHQGGHMPDKRTPEEVSQLEADATAYAEQAEFHYQNDETVLYSLDQDAAEATQRKLEGEES